jgi:hypothetical protein
MASNQVSNQRNKPPGTHKSPQNMQSSMPRMGESSDEEQGYMGALTEQATDYVQRGASQARELVRDREGTAVAVALAAGLGVGMMIGCALVRSHHQERNWRDRITAEGFGRRLMDRIESLIPNALSDHFGK